MTTEKPKRKDNTSKEAKKKYASNRLKTLDISAKAAGYKNWRDLEKAVFKYGVGVIIPPRVSPEQS